MSTFLISFIVVALAVAGLAAGTLMGRAPIRGSCGGMNNCACAKPCARRQSAGRRPESGD